MNIASWLVSNVTVAPETTRDRYGKPAFGTRRTVKCRIQPQSSIVRNARGEDVRSSWRLYCSESIALTERVWLAGADTSKDEGGLMPIAITISADKTGAQTLYRIDL
jgi:hypothetical protein